MPPRQTTPHHTHPHRTEAERELRNSRSTGTRVLCALVGYRRVAHAMGETSSKLAAKKRAGFPLDLLTQKSLLPRGIGARPRKLIPVLEQNISACTEYIISFYDSCALRSLLLHGRFNFCCLSHPHTAAETHRIFWQVPKNKNTPPRCAHTAKSSSPPPSSPCLLLRAKLLDSAFLFFWQIV